MAVADHVDELDELQRSGALALKVLHALPAMTVMVVDRDLRYVLCAGEALAASGLDPATMEGRLVRDVLEGARREVFEEHCRRALDGVASTYVAHREGRAYDVRVEPLLGRAGIIGARAIARDISERDEALRALAAREREFRGLTETASDVISRSDVDGTYTYVSPAAERVYGWRPEELVGRAVRDFVHPEDHARHVALRAELQAGAREHVGEFRIPHKQGGWVWVEVRYTALHDAHGAPAGVQAASRDITDRKRAEAARRVADQQFQTAFDSAAIGMALVSTVGAFLRVNAALEALLGRDERELLATDFQAITHPDDLDTDMALLEAVLAGGRSSYQLEKRYLRPDGSAVWALLSVSLVRDDAGAPLHFVSQVQDISERKRLEGELERLASRDELTGLCNRWSFERELERQVVGERADASRCVLALLDLDGLKAVNDALGHHVGDELLRHVGSTLQRSVLAGDVVARLGGDEFAILLRRPTAEAAEACAQQLHHDLEQSPLDFEGHRIPVRASLGLVELERDGDAARRAADAAMYAHKRRRRGAPAVAPHSGTPAG